MFFLSCVILEKLLLAVILIDRYRNISCERSSQILNVITEIPIFVGGILISGSQWTFFHVSKIVS